MCRMILNIYIFIFIPFIEVINFVMETSHLYWASKEMEMLVINYQMVSVTTNDDTLRLVQIQS